MTTEENPTPTSTRRFVVSVVNIMHALGHVNLQGVPVLYPLLRDHFEFGYMGIAFLTLVRQLVMGPMQISFGVLTRLARRFHILAIGNALSFLGTLIMGVSQSYSHLVIGTVTRSFGLTPYHPVGGALMVSLFPKDRAKALGLYQTAGNVGSLIAPLAAGALLHFMGWRSVILILGIPFFIASVLCFAVKEPPVQANISDPKKSQDRFGFKEYKAVFQDRNTIILSLTMMVGAGGRGGGVIQTYLAVLLVDRFGISPSFAAMLFAAFTFGGVLGPLSMGWFSDRTSSLVANQLNLLFSAVFVVLILQPAVPGILLALVVFSAGFFIGSRNTLLQALLLQGGTPDARIDTQLSLYFSIGAFSGPAWTLLIGVLVDRFGMDVAIWTMAASYIFGMGILSFIRIEKPTDKPAT
jgi:MFS transporter, FSR family, fosmidomycin resistance protein